ncbi:hypothetical protein FACS189490_05350 [Clostridia bacterium]|nr:hypothetical protein FACS189490_05350 [Clostridia bacterium]
MLCENCKQHDAEIIIRQTINGGEPADTALCAECAMKSIGFMPLEFMVKNFMNSIMAEGGLFSGKNAGETETDEVKCPSCGLSYEGFKSSGRLGCAACYDAFRSRLIPVFKSVHGSSEHAGKYPARSGANLSRLHEIDVLKKKLSGLIAEEEFEEAAKVRDQIKGLSV